MKKYKVTMYYHTNCTVVVEANSEEEALENAYCVNCNGQLLEGLQEDNAPNIEEIC